MKIGQIVGGFVVILALLFIGSGFFTVEPGEVAFTKKFGEIQPGVYTEGLNFKTPVIEDAVKISIKDKKVTTEANSASKDLQDVSTKISVNYAIAKESAITLYQTIGKENQVESIIVAPSIQEAVKASTARYTASQLITSREQVREDITALLESKFSARGLVLAEVNIENFTFSQTFDAAIEEKVKAEQRAQQALNELERVKAESQAEIEKSKAEAEKIRIQAEAVTSQGGAEYVQLQWIAQWDGKLPQYVLGDSTSMLMNMPAQE